MCPLYHTHIMVYEHSNAIFISDLYHKFCNGGKVGIEEKGAWDKIWQVVEIIIFCKNVKEK